jgi:hypothetical protein
MSEILDLLREAREMCGMAWSDGDPDDLAGRIDRFLREGGGQEVDLTRDQISMLALLTHQGEVGKTTKIVLEQTWTKSGGTHLYVTTPRGEYHLARNGNLIEIGVVVDGEVDRHTARYR